MISKQYSVVLAIATASLLTGCVGETQRDVQKWMADETKKMRGRVDPISEPKKFEPFKYLADKQVDPFNTSKIVAVADPKVGKPGGGLKPNFDRPKEILELSALEAMTMVGVLQQKGTTFALVRDSKTLHRVKVGNYIGQNFGLITKIDESEISLKELVQDATGDWVERVSTMQLQEAGKK
jgi:type IV pilus assembly protein PilP